MLQNFSFHFPVQNVWESKLSFMHASFSSLRDHHSNIVFFNQIYNLHTSDWCQTIFPVIMHHILLIEDWKRAQIASGSSKIYAYYCVIFSGCDELKTGKMNITLFCSNTAAEPDETQWGIIETQFQFLYLCKVSHVKKRTYFPTENGNFP